MKKVKWGILGLGKIANKFADDLSKLTDCELVSVGSRSQEKANQFAEKYQCKNAYGSYQQLADCKDAEVIYIATPHTFHEENTIQCLLSHKHVLCEKPFAINLSQVNNMIDVAIGKNKFLMEAIWTGLLPALKKIKQLIDDQTIGDVKLIEADFGFFAKFDSQSRLFDPDLGGGSLLDIGIYPLFLAHYILGKPTSISANALLASNGVDSTTSMILRYNNNTLASLFSTIDADTMVQAKIYGTKGSIHIPSRWHEAKEFTLNIGEQTKVYSFEDDFRGYAHEIREVNDCIRNNKQQSDILPLKLSQELMDSMDEIRKQIGLRYPSE